MMEAYKINRILGVSLKEAATQKTWRSQALATQDRAYSMVYHKDEPLILRVRNPRDKRSFLCTLTPKGPLGKMAEQC